MHNLPWSGRGCLHAPYRPIVARAHDTSGGLYFLKVEIVGDALGINIAFVNVISHGFGVGFPVFGEIDGQNFLDGRIDRRPGLWIVLAQFENAALIIGGQAKLANIRKSRQQFVRCGFGRRL